MLRYEVPSTFILWRLLALVQLSVILVDVGVQEVWPILQPMRWVLACMDRLGGVEGRSIVGVQLVQAPHARRDEIGGVRWIDTAFT